tara:strand:- start:3561 stop:4373 length:813 start_codon:yes stop_codon:yes gene_type:complete
MANYTLTYSESSKGFPSFYSFYPDFMIGMNNYLYSFNKGQIYRHNTNVARNTFYGVVTGSTMTTVINQEPLDNKVFKTISLESTHAWAVDLNTDIDSQSSTVNSGSFENKEGQYFTYLRNDGVDSSGGSLSAADYKSRSVRGIGECTSVSGPADATSIVFNINIDISSSVNINDYIYFASSGDTFADYGGRITSITTDQVAETTTVVIDTTVGLGNAPVANDFIFAAKNSAAESTGVSGHYAEITLSLPSTVTTASELFSIESDVIKSYP